MLPHAAAGGHDRLKACGNSSPNASRHVDCAVSEERSSQMQTDPKHTMDRALVSSQPHELKYLAETHGASIDEVEQVIREVGSRSRRLIEQELDKRYSHRPRGGSKGHDEGQPRTPSGSSDKAGR
jgi:hypothetical protein